MPSTVPPALTCEVCILAGGASSRMGRNKAALRLGGRSLLGHVRSTAKQLGLPVRVIRRDLIPGCGPLGGIQGTIYAPAQTALVFVTASGVANVQVIAGKIQIDSAANARFAYTPQFFANGVIRLIE